MKCKKLFALLLSLCMIASLFVAVPASAAGITTVTVGNVEAAAGEAIVVPVSISNNQNGVADEPGLTGITLNVKYDTTALAFNRKDTVAGEALPDLDLTKPGTSYTEGDLTFNWDGTDADSTDGEILLMAFDVLETATAGDYTIEVTVKSACDYDMEDVEVAVVNGKVTIPAAVAGPTTLTVGNVEAAAGDAIVVPVVISNNQNGVEDEPGLTGLTINVKYDKTALAFNRKDTVAGEALPDLDLTKPGTSYTEGDLTFNWDGTDADSTDGEILLMAFDVLGTAAPGEYTINVEVTSACDYDMEDVEVVVVNGKVTVKGAEPTTITVSDVEGAVGGAIVVPIVISNNQNGVPDEPGLTGLTINVKYDTTALAFNRKDTVAGEALTDLDLTKPGAAFEEGNLNFNWDGTDPDSSDGEILLIAFDVLETATAGEYTIDLTVTSACDFDTEDLAVVAVDGKVTIEFATHECEWDAGEVTKAPTCTETGVKTYTCTSCGATKTEDISVDPNAHSYDAGVITTPATHITAGVKTYTCTACSATYTEEIPADVNAHEYDEGVITTPATCTATGVKTFTCTCGDTYTEEIAALGHEYDAGVVTKAPTCTEAGVKTFTCSRCSDSYTEEIAATGHDISAVAEVPATCTVNGTKAHYLCANCGKTFEDEAGNTEVAAEDLVIAALGHAYGEWQKDDAENHKKVCSSCGDTVTEAHTWGAGVITLQPTRTEDGEWEFKCSVCDEEKTETINKVSESDNITNVTVSNISTKGGSEIKVPVTISKNAGLVGLILNVEFDKTVLTLTGAEKGTGLGGLELTIPEDLSQQPSIFLWDGLNADSSNGEIVVLKFKVADGATEGEYPISITVTSACDQDLNDVIVCANNGAVNVIDYAPGDLDDDGKIGAKDIVLIRRFITAGYNVNIIEDAADVNKDNQVESKDVVLLRRYIVGGFGVVLR